MDIVSLINTSEPPYVIITNPAEYQAVARPASESNKDNVFVCEFNAFKMLKLTDIYDYFQAAFDFPDYFGRNLDALFDMMTDLSWISCSKFIILIDNFDEFGSFLSRKDRDVFVQVLNDIGKVWATPVERDEWWDRGPIPFHFICSSEI